MKAVKIFAALILFAAVLSFAVSAEANDSISSGIKASGADKLTESLDSETQSLLSELGIDEINFESVLNTSPRSIITLIIEIFRGRLHEPMKMLLKSVGIIMLVSCAQSFMPGDEKTRSVMNTAGGLLIAVTVAASMTAVMPTACAAIELSGNFMLALIPVLTAVIASSGNAMLAITYNSAAFAASQGMMRLVTDFIVPCCGFITGIGVIDAVVPDLKLGSLGGFIKKISLWVFSALATLFTGFLSLRGILAGSADTLAAKGMKLAIGSFIPIVGSQLSEAYSAVAVSMGIVRTTVGAFGIIAVLLINLPVIIELLLWTASLKLSDLLAECLEVKCVSGMLKALSSALVLLNVCVIFSMSLTIISTGTVLAIKMDL